MSILVTGTYGFIRRRVCAALKREEMSSWKNAVVPDVAWVDVFMQELKYPEIAFHSANACLALTLDRQITRALTTSHIQVTFYEMTETKRSPAQ